MEFKKRLKIRLYVGITYIFLGIAMIVCGFCIKPYNSYLSSFGLAMIVLGLVRIRNHRIISRNEETLKKQEIAETDERNVAIVNNARSLAFTVYIILSCLAVIILALLKLKEISVWISLSVCVLVAIYWVCYLIYSKIS